MCALLYTGNVMPGKEAFCRALRNVSNVLRDQGAATALGDHGGRQRGPEAAQRAGHLLLLLRPFGPSRGCCTGLRQPRRATQPPLTPCA